MLQHFQTSLEMYTGLQLHVFRLMSHQGHVEYEARIVHCSTLCVSALQIIKDGAAIGTAHLIGQIELRDVHNQYSDQVST